MADDRAVTALESFLAERGEPLLRTAVLLTGGKEAGEDLLQAPAMTYRPTGIRPGGAVLRPEQRAQATRRYPGVLVSVATHSTWWVMGNASNARSAPSSHPASANSAMSRASVAGSHDT